MMTNMRVHIILLIILGSFIYPLLKDTQIIQPGVYKQVHSILNRIVKLDAASEENMMQLQNGQTSNYDTLTADAISLEISYATIVQTLPANTSLTPHLNKLKASVQLQLDTIDVFRSTFGILQNSKRYLSILIAQNIQAKPALTENLLRLRGDLFEFLALPDDALQQRIIRQQQAMEASGFVNLSHHINILLRYGQKIQQQIYTVTHCGTPEHTYQLSDAYDAVYTKQIQALKDKRVWLFGLITLFSIYLIIVLYLLMRSESKLKGANTSLENSKLALEQELIARKQTEARYRTLIDSSSAAIMTYANNCFISANPATLNMFGIKDQQDILQMSAAAVSPPFQADGRDSATAAQDYIGTAMREGHCAFEWLHQRQNGDVFPAHVQLTAIEVGTERMFQAVVTDISDLKQLEEDKELLASALENTADAVLIADEEARIVYTNTAFEKMTGYSRNEVIGQFASILRSEQKKDPVVYERMLKKLNQGKAWKGELLTRLKSGDEILVDRTISPVVDHSGTVVSHVAIMRDITDEKEQSKKWEHTQRLESLGVLAGGIAHDFNNILTAIMGNASLAERSLEMTSPAKSKLANIETAAQRAADLCQQMLAYSGKGKFIVQPIDLSKLVDEMVHLVDVSIQKNVVIKYHMADNLPAVEADIAQLQQIILNLITNASEAIGKRSGVISFSTGVMHADARYLSESLCDDAVPEGRFAYLEVSDTGCGMDAATIEKMFDPFFTTKFTGRGLGMSAVLGIIRGHHGALRVYSEIDKGTTFKVLLPVTEQDMTEEVHADLHTEHGLATGTILIVDDEETIREVAAMMLEEIGFSTLTANDGMEAVEVYRQHQGEITAVLLDMTMPRMDGKACFRELRRINNDVKVVLSSGYSEEDATEQFQGKRLSGFVQKPYTPEHLKEVMMNVCSSKDNS